VTENGIIFPKSEHIVKRGRRAVYTARALFAAFLVLAAVVFFKCYSADGRQTALRADMRPFPAPYSAMLAICSDIDDTTPEEFEEYHRFLNTRDATPWGPGLGLDVADSMFFYMANDQPVTADNKGRGNSAVMTFFIGTGDQYKNAGLIAYYCDAGWIDSMHSYGDFSMADQSRTPFNRSLAERAAREMVDRHMGITVWTNHGNMSNAQNLENSLINSKDSYRKGGDPASPYYHADLTIPAGIKYVWFSNNDGNFGVDTPLYPAQLGDGRRVWGFNRHTGRHSAFSSEYYWSVFFMHKQLTAEHLDGIVRKNQFSIIAQHFGGANYYYTLTDDAVESLKLLAEYQQSGDILVARTSRLLEYARARDLVQYERIESDGGVVINITAIDDPQLGMDTDPALDSLRGLTFYVPDADTAVIAVNGRELDEDELARYGGRNGEGASIGVKWFESDTRDFTYGGQHFYH